MNRDARGDQPRMPCNVRKVSSESECKNSKYPRICKARRSNFIVFVSILVAYAFLVIFDFMYGINTLINICAMMGAIFVVSILLENEFIDSMAVTAFPVPFIALLVDIAWNVMNWMHYVNIALAVVALILNFKRAKFSLMLISSVFFMFVAIAQGYLGYIENNAYVINIMNIGTFYIILGFYIMPIIVFLTSCETRKYLRH